MNRTSFSIIIIPDTQYVTGRHPHLLLPMTNWILDHAQELNLQIVLHLGDIVDSGAKNEEEYVTAASAMNRLSKADIPFVICPGNHDYDNLLMQDRSLNMFNRYFGPALYRGKPWFGGLFEEGRAENMFVKLDADGRKLLVLALEFGPRDEVLVWADSVLESNRDREAIIITHNYMYIHGERTTSGDDHHPKMYPGAFGANDGEEMWQKSLRKHPNVIAVFSGHHVPGNISYRVDLGDHGNPVFQSFQNWQKTEYGGEGRFRIMRFLADGDGIELSVLHPQTGLYEESPGCQFTFPNHRKKQEMGGSSIDWSSFRHPMLDTIPL